MSELTRDELVAELASMKCQCGKKKMPPMTFCSGCYHKLPKPLRNALYLKIGHGYEGARKRAGEILAEKGQTGNGPERKI